MIKILDPININGLILKNRLVMPPMATAKASNNDSLSKEAIDYYVERAKFSKIGMIITEHSYIHISGKAHPGQVSLANDEVIENFKQLAMAVHSENVKILAQLNHAGSAAKSSITNYIPMAPSSIYHPKQKQELPVEMTKEQILDCVEWFVNSAKRVKQAGFDGIEIHSAHGYLLNQFYSPLYNQRQDEYGNRSLESRVLFHRQVIEAIRKQLGKNFIISIRFGGCDYQDGGSTIEDCLNACVLFEKYGVDIIHISGGMNGYIKPGLMDAGYFRDMSKVVKKYVKIPVILTGGIKTIDEANNLILNDDADLIGIGRAIYRNSHWTD